jgi:hypothetical protein
MARISAPLTPPQAAVAVPRIVVSRMPPTRRPSSQLRTLSLSKASVSNSRSTPSVGEASASDSLDDSGLGAVTGIVDRHWLSLPVPTDAFAEALNHLDERNARVQALAPARGPRPVGAHIFPLHPSAAHLRERQHMAQRRQAEGARMWREDPSSYKQEEAPEDKIRRHQLANHEPPHGVSNRPLSPKVREARTLDVQSTWIVSGNLAQRPSTTVTAMTAQTGTMIYDTAERLSMLQAAKSMLADGENPDMVRQLHRSGPSPRLYSPSSPFLTELQARKDAIMPYDGGHIHQARIADDAQGISAETCQPSPVQMQANSVSSPLPHCENGHMNADQARYLRGVDYFEKQHTIKVSHMREMEMRAAARQMAMARGARLSPSSFSPPSRQLVSGGVIASKKNRVEGFVCNAYSLADLHLRRMDIEAEDIRTGISGQGSETGTKSRKHPRGQFAHTQSRPEDFSASSSLQDVSSVDDIFLRRPG